MPSLVTSIIGGIQGASAAHNAASAQQQGYQTAGQSVQNAVSQVNPTITSAAQQAGTGVTGAAGQLTSMLSPYTTGGATAMGDLTAGMAPGGSLSTPFTASMMAQYSPAYQFQLQQGTLAANRAAAAQGLTGSGGTAKALQQYTQNYANNAFGTAANLYNTQQQAQFNRLATMAGAGQTGATAAGQAGIGAAQYAGTAGIGAANQTASNTLSGANYLANTQIQAQNALAQGDLGAAQQWNNMLGGIGTSLNQAAMLGFGAGGGWNLSNIGSNIGNYVSGGWGGGGGNAGPTSMPGFQYPTMGWNQSGF